MQTIMKKLLCPSLLECRWNVNQLHFVGFSFHLVDVVCPFICSLSQSLIRTHTAFCLLCDRENDFMHIHFTLSRQTCYLVCEPVDNDSSCQTKSF